MNDRELLELAAKAYGPEVEWDGDGWVITSKFRGHLTNYEAWNPLADDGDALRLAAKLEMNVGNGIRRSIEAWTVSEDDGGVYRGVEPKGDDVCAATRRAIVRAAAAVQQAKEAA
ncbi:Phage ABA sandwich domain-containing protein OS=Bosea thiooxidans OX=53254 GN=SAMN05660750_01651 PE=4 SV=1 [Bosea thiooxidans]|uniref:Phage ABA sandwich domain-containing protein n=1 Tax=Bosea thiooxidans TaxID=53254 RepID=A0A1T5CTQ9_9HYPH|nr:hypothetical protein [Bosea thiooxidans]SKB62908.1 hypothetical protein SAMN05660750_01651 [Bosea thiooxidans]